MLDNEQELLKLETEIYHSDGGIYFAECDSASTRDEIAQQLENRFINKNVKVIKINVRMAGIASTRDEIARRLEEISSSKKAGEISELNVLANNLPYAVTQYPGDDAAFFVYLPSEKSELEDLARILNYTREEFAEVKQPIIIWVDKVSLGVITQSAPDFWAWRARVSEFRSVSDDLGYGGEVGAVKTLWRGKISDEEIRAYEREFKEFKDRGDEKEVAKISGQLGLLHYRRNKWDLAIEYYEKSMKIFEALGDRHGLAQTYNNLGLVYADKGEWDLAIEYYEKDMEISEALGDRHGLAQTYNNLGLVYADKGEWDLAIEYYEKSMKIKEALGDRHGLAQTYNNLGAVYARKGEWDLAIEYYEKDMEISEALGDRHGAGVTLSNIGKLYLDRSDPMRAKENLEAAIKNIRPDARPAYPNALNWFAVSLRLLAEQKKREAKLASSDVEREKLVTAAAKLYGEAAERYEATYNLPLSRMPRSLMMYAHLARGLAFSVQNITEEDSKKAIALLDRAIAEMEFAIECADGADAIRFEGEIASHKAKRCVREIGLHRDDANKRDELLDLAISHLGEAAESFSSLGDTGACSSKTRDGCRHLYTALGLIRDGYRNKSNQNIMDAVSEIRSAEECYQGISNELGTGVVDQVNEILRRVADNLKNIGGFDPAGVIDAANDVFDALDEISGVGLRNVIKILVFDEVGNVTEREIPTMGSSGGNSASDSGVIFSGDIGDNATISIDTGNKPPPDKRKAVSLWDCVLGAVGSILTGIISAISMSLYSEEPINNFRTPAIIISVIMLSVIIYARYRISNLKT